LSFAAPALLAQSNAPSAPDAGNFDGGNFDGEQLDGEKADGQELVGPSGEVRDAASAEAPTALELWRAAAAELGLADDAPPDGAALCDAVLGGAQALTELVPASAWVAAALEFGAPTDAFAELLIALYPALFAELGPLEAERCVEQALPRAAVPEFLVRSVRLELARQLLFAERLVDCTRVLQATRAAGPDSAAVASLVAAATPSTPGPRLSELELVDAFYWYVTRAHVDRLSGRAAAVSESLRIAQLLAERAASPALYWEVVDAQIVALFALQAYDEVEPYLDAASAKGWLAALEPSERAAIEVRRTLARHELSRRKSPGDLTHLEALRALVLASDASDRNRRARSALAAGYYAEAGARERAEELFALAEQGGRPNSGLEAAQHQALALRIALLSADRERIRAELERLESLVGAFLDEWAALAALSPSSAVLQFASRERVLESLVRGCIAVDGQATGARRALEWIYRAQCIGGVARGLGLERASADLARDLAELAGPRRVLCVLLSGRERSHLFVIDATSIRVCELADGWSLRQLASKLANEATRAVRAGGSRDAFDAAEAALESVLAPAELAQLTRYDECTVVGDESVGHLPLALVRSADGGRLGEHLALAHAPSIPVAAELARRARSRGKSAAEQFNALLLGAPPAPADVTVDPARLERWRERLGATSRLAVGAQALPRELDAHGRGFELVQVIAHGDYDVQRETRAGFVLWDEAGEPSRVTSETVERAAAARLTALAVCRASQRPVMRGDDGRTGLAASFVLAGSDCVLQTGIDLEVGAAVDLFERVSLHVARGEAPARALMLARRGQSAAPAHLQDFFVHAWGAAFEPLVDAASAAHLPPIDDAGQSGWSALARWWWLVAALCVAALALTRRSKSSSAG
jgi:hypothetical protein